MCVHIRYTSNMAAYYDNDVNNVSAPDVYAEYQTINKFGAV